MRPNDLLEVIDRTLASARAALAAADSPAHSDQEVSDLSGRAGADLARLPTAPRNAQGTDVTPDIFDDMRQAQRAANEGDLAGAERHLTAARERLGGPST